MILLTISIICWRYNVLRLGKDINLTTFVKLAYSSGTTLLLWYLYSYIGIMMMLPILRKLVLVTQNQEYLYLAGMLILFIGIVPIVEYLVFQGKYSLNGNLKRVLFTITSIVYFLMGYYFDHIMLIEYFHLCG